MSSRSEIAALTEKVADLTERVRLLEGRLNKSAMAVAFRDADKLDDYGVTGAEVTE